MDTEILMEKIDRLDTKVQGLVNQVDQDRRDIDLLRMDQKAIKEGQESTIKQLTDMKKELRQAISDEISLQLPRVAKKVIREEIRLLSARNPKKVIKGRLTIWDRVYKLFKRHG